MGLFFYTKKGSIISTVDLPTTEIIEPFIKCFIRKFVIFNENSLSNESGMLKYEISRFF